MEKKSGDDLNYLITFVGGGHDGAVYKADNWEAIRNTAGLPSHKSVSMKWDDADGLKAKFRKTNRGKQKGDILQKIKIIIIF